MCNLIANLPCSFFPLVLLIPCLGSFLRVPWTAGLICKVLAPKSWDGELKEAVMVSFMRNHDEKVRTMLGAVSTQCSRQVCLLPVSETLSLKAVHVLRETLPHFLTCLRVQPKPSGAFSKSYNGVVFCMCVTPRQRRPRFESLLHRRESLHLLISAQNNLRLNASNHKKLTFKFPEHLKPRLEDMARSRPSQKDSFTATTRFCRRKSSIVIRHK